MVVLTVLWCHGGDIIGNGMVSSLNEEVEELTDVHVENSGPPASKVHCFTHGYLICITNF